MKKLVAVLAAAVLAGGAIFAGDFYNGDIQIQIGGAFDKATVQDVDTPIKGTLFDFGVESWHLFKPLDLLGVGFSVGFNGGVGTTERWSYSILGTKVQGSEDGLSANFNFSIGPAVGLYLGNIVRFGFNIGYTAGFNFDEPFVYEVTTRYSRSTGRIQIWSAYSGINLGLQAKFFPNSVVNPVIGWRLVAASSNEYEYSISSSLGGSNNDGVRTAREKYEFTQNVIYAALSFSW